METFKDVELTRLKNLMLYVINRIPGCDMHKLSKILYFAERSFVVKYARPFTGDQFIAMEYGPVPSQVYDAIKFLQKKRSEETPLATLLAGDVALKGNHLTLKAGSEVDTDYLSTTDIETLDESITEYAPRKFEALSDISHDTAWESTSPNGKMNVMDIATAGGGDEYVHEALEEYLTLTQALSSKQG